MISEIRVKARAASMEDAEREIHDVLAHAQLAGYMEGIVPQSSSVTENHFGHVTQPDRWSGHYSYDQESEDHAGGMFPLEYEGRVVLRFDPEDAPSGGVKQFGFRVTTDGEPFSPEAADRDALGVHVTDRVIVLRRQRPMTRDSVSDGLAGDGLGVLVAIDRKLTPEDMAAFTVLALHEDVQEASFGPSRARPGWEVTYSAMHEMTPPSPGSSGTNGNAGMGIGRQNTVYGETFRDAVEAALAEVRSLGQPFTEVRSATVRVGA